MEDRWEEEREKAQSGAGCETDQRIAKRKGRLLNAAGRFSDYWNYAADLSSLEEEYDQTLEIYDFPVWMGNSHGAITEKAQEMLKATSELFDELSSIAQDELYLAVLDVCRSGQEEQKQIWGMVLSREPSKDELLDYLTDWEWRYTQNEALEQVIALIKQGIKRKEEEERTGGMELV